MAALQASPSVNSSFPPSWNQFLAAPQLWTYPSPPFTMMVRRSILQILNGDATTAAATPMIEYLVWRRDLNPTRFDYYHPYLGPRLSQLLAPPQDVPITPLVEPPITPLAPLTTNPPSVPEPNGLMLIGLISAVGLWRRYRDASRAGRRPDDLLHSCFPKGLDRELTP